jgi:hypothetical protein
MKRIRRCGQEFAGLFRKRDVLCDVGSGGHGSGETDDRMGESWRRRS